MKVYAINSKPNFRGFNNIISHSISKSSGMNFSFMAMELNNQGEKDLDTWIELQKKLMPNRKPVNHIFFQSTSIFGKNILALEDIVINMHNDFSNLNLEFSKEKEPVFIKANSFLASLTRRISRTENHPEDGKIYLVLIEVIKNLTNILGNKKYAEEMATLSSFKAVKHRVTADIINSNIARNMTKYFKL